MKIMSKIILLALVCVGNVIPQSIEANYQLDYVTVHYTWVARAQESTLDFEIGNYDLMGSWPSSAMPAFQWTLASFAPGDTVTEVLVPLTFQGALDFFPYGAVGLNCTFLDNGTFTINEGSTYPTTQLIDCETSSTVPPVSESGTWTDGGYSPYADGFLNTSVRGWGITNSGTFAWFDAPDLGDGTNSGGVYDPNMQYDGEHDGSENDIVNWGRFDSRYNNDYSQIQDAWVRWTANDGTESNLGIVDPTDDFYVEEEAGMLNGIMGIATAPSDNTTIPAVAYLAAQMGITIHVPEDPVALGGTGQDMDGDGEPDGLLSANWGYLFDPAGDDGAPFSGDEMLQFTGYYFTGNFLNAIGVGQGTLTACGTAYVMGDDPTANGGLGNGCLLECVMGGGDVATCSQSCQFLSVEECIDDATVAVLTTFGCPAEVAGAVASMAYVEGDVAMCLMTGGDPLICVLGGVLWGVGAAQVATGGAWMFPNDSDHDVDLACLADGNPSDCTGRLLFEVDNLCLPRMSTQRINARFQNTANAHGAANPVFMSTDAGWNMVGLPIVAGGYEYGDMFGVDLNGDGVADTPGATDGTLYSFNGSYNEEAAMDPGQGYWLRFDMACCDPAIYGVPGHPMGGYDLLTQTISLSEGWNMISGISASADPSADVDDPGGVIVGGSLYGFSGTYNAASSIDPGQGYWVRASANGDVTISIGAGGAGRIAEPVDYLKNTSYLTIANGDGLKGMPLHFGAAVPENDKIRYGMPPLPPAGAFDARFAGDMRYTEDMGTIEIMNSTESLTFDYLVVNQEKWTFTINGEDHVLEGSGTIEVDGSVNSVTLRKGTVPSTFSLKQNYPNPFNPTTQIAFELPDPQTVNITVWNLAGQQVATIHTGELNEGLHSFNFDGSQLASGAYIYRVNAGPYQATKKMLLMK